MLIEEFFAREDHGDADGGQEECVSELGTTFHVNDTIVGEEIVEALFAEALSVVRGDVVDCLCSVPEWMVCIISTVHHFANGVFRPMIMVFVKLTSNSCSDSCLEGLVPEGVQATCLDQIKRTAEFFADHKEFRARWIVVF